MSAKVHKPSCINLNRAAQGNLVWNETIASLATLLWRGFAAQRQNAEQHTSPAYCFRRPPETLPQKHRFPAQCEQIRRLARAPTAARDGACAPQKGALQLDDLRGVNVLARVNFAEQLFARGGIEIQHRE